MKQLSFFCLLLCSSMFSQTLKDTSYTVQSTYKKEIGKYPVIKIVQKPPVAAVNIIKDRIYKTISHSRDLHLDAFICSQNAIQPIVVLIHGGGWKSGDKSQMHFLAQEIAKNGYACFCVEYRLSDEAKYPAGVLDVVSAIEYIKENAAAFQADTTKIAALGCSSGGQMASLIGASGNTFFKANAGKPVVQAVINMDGILAFRHPESEEGKAAALWLGGTFEENPTVWRDASALTHCGKDTPPILFINSDKPRFHAGRDDMIAIMNEHGIYSEVKTIQNSPHSFWFFEPWFDEIVVWSTQFLDKIFNK